MTDNLQNCLTCRRQTENFLQILDESNVENVEAILTKHFWFKTAEYEHRVLCISCWEKIDEFHKFYCEVEERWCSKSDLLESVVKTEQLFDENEAQSELFTCELIKVEEENTKLKPIIDASESEENNIDENVTDDDDDYVPIGEDAIDSEFKQEDESSEDSTEESSMPIGKRRNFTRMMSASLKEPAQKKRHVKSLKSMNLKRNALIAKYVQLVCDLCGHKSETFSRLLLHYRRIHEIQGYVTCCNRAFQKKSGLFEHLSRHESGAREPSPPQIRCELCDASKTFKDEEGLQLHNVIYHSKQEKTFQCDQCDKAFSSEWHLSGHKSWHQNVASLNIHCDKCNKYFNSIRTLNTHMRAHHATALTSSANLSNTVSVTAESTIPEPIIACEEQDSTMEYATLKPPNVISIAASVTSEPPKKGGKSAEEVAKEDEFIRRFCTLVCDKCDFAGRNYYQLDKHFRTDHNMRGYAICCGRKFCKKRRLYEHCQRHINPDMFRCEVLCFQICSKSFTESKGLEKHNKWVHTPDSEKPFKCEICDAAFYKDYLLRNHMKYHISMEQKIFKCKECDKSFGTAVLLRAHQQNIHGAVSSWVCDICAKGFVHKSLLERHRISHSPEGAASLKMQCENCKKWLKNRDTYQNHRKRCLAGGPVTCDVCGKEAVNELALASHKRFNHEERPAFACSYCGKQFKRILRLKEHEANHRGEVLYSCPYCPRTCNSSSNMYTHKKVAHPELWAAKVAERFYKK
ncbi:zinc finger protein 85-like isoform X1 [Topomyia yanbarensis]|uniref:zinc finger protein 85-like isoform X1 n=1 Tax=Topomyia yanbarensis TaxID=2498891 RepID=UPI00273AD331|nr:zinc finger protein 85-like isoform X1 [Topomyia yanbarensis]